MNFLVRFSRVLVGSLFIISGLVKANDPLGFSYKLQEYFAESALNLPFLEPYALILGVLACLAEVVLGFAVLFGGKTPLASWALLLLTLFFGWLTMYTATCDPQGTYTVLENGKEITRTVTCVTDCGCFGDALKGSLGRSLTPWESFAKDMVLLVFIIPIFIRRNSIKLNDNEEDLIILGPATVTVAFLSWVFSWYFPLGFFAVVVLGYLLVKLALSPAKAEWPVAALVTIASAAFIYYCHQHLPLRDYRAFAIGKSIKEGMTLPEGAKHDVYESKLTYRNSLSGEEKEFTSENYPWQDSTWVWVKTDNILIQKGDEAPIHDFNLIAPDGNDYTEDILNEPYIFLLVCYDIRKTTPDRMADINKFADDAGKAGYYLYGVTASGYDDVENFRHQNQAAFDFYTADETTLKTIIRSNPGLVMLKEGTVIGQWHWNDIPNFESVKNELIK